MLFGGGSASMGSGDLQSSLKVVADTDAELYHMHIDLFLAHATPKMLNVFRSDVSFKLTYYYGRTGTITKNMVVGHSEALLQVTDSVILLGPTVYLMRAHLIFSKHLVAGALPLILALSPLAS